MDHLFRNPVYPRPGHVAACELDYLTKAIAVVHVGKAVPLSFVQSERISSERFFAREWPEMPSVGDRSIITRNSLSQSVAGPLSVAPCCL